MNAFKIVSFAGVFALLSACGGGGGGSTTGDNSDDETSTEPELVIEYASDPLEPRVFNLSSSDPSTEHHFDPTDTINLIWDMDINYSDNSVVPAGETHVYDASVYFSDDNTFDASDDTLVFEIECVFPSSSEHACGDAASFQCVYAPGNTNTLSCTSIPLGKDEGITALSIDISAYLNVVPKVGNVIYRSCLREEPEKCAVASSPIQLN